MRRATHLFLLLILTQAGYCQVQTSHTLVENLASRFVYRPQLDSSINVNTLSREQCNQIIERMHVIDQQYRSELGSDMSRQDEAAQKAGRLMTINDQSNQAILLKILHRFGWPCDDPKRQLGYKAYIIAWHARGDYDKMAAFYPYLQRATRYGCMHPAHEQEYSTWLTNLKRVYRR
ncbi:hypothetical protein FAES_5159 [Fibrella aestuarina BUZ 2]|uniref:Uncharacterized protein n=1 Tax=Fibrella aestuarina BUZ 2 TaxID=1166018 RepID=I0KGA5_9BACT|nr:hypothetical protein [Fibrella aestuarina]CCH03158.1 hypothetical protein FAES_5159 [Fibrella aestuarina BUZ 2]